MESSTRFFRAGVRFNDQPLSLLQPSRFGEQAEEPFKAHTLRPAEDLGLAPWLLLQALRKRPAADLVEQPFISIRDRFPGIVCLGALARALTICLYPFGVCQ
jgi:hypothetical protein